MPKIELHLHLEGAIPHDALWVLVQKYDGQREIPDLKALERAFEYRDFPHFIEMWHWKNRFLREYEDFSFIAEAVARDLARQRVRYAEVFFSPPDFARYGLAPQPLAVAIRRGLERVPSIDVRLVADLVRDSGPERAARTLAEITEVRDQGVIGIGIGGSEHDFPPEPFADVFERARRVGFHTSAHAGEVAGAASVWGAIGALRAERIGHGTRAEEEPALVEHLAAAQIPIEMCPISNQRTGAVSQISDHPVRRYFDGGLLVTVNTDDPKMFGNSLADEFTLLETGFGFSRDEIRDIILNGVRAAWLSDEEKRELRDCLTTDPSWS